MVVDPLSRHPGFLPLLAAGFGREWPAWTTRVGRQALEAIFESDPAGGLPLVLVAHAGGEPLGTIALRAWFAEAPMAETPWVRQLYVFPPHRGRGVDRALMEAVAHHARRLGYDTLHAATNRIERLLVRRGWEVFRRVPHDGEELTWLRKSIAPPGSTQFNK